MKGPRPHIDPLFIFDLCEAVYRIRLEAECPGNVQRMIEKDKGDAEKLRARSDFYLPMVRATLKAIGVEPGQEQDYWDKVREALKTGDKKDDD